MGVLIKDMEKPKSCYAVIDGEFKYCPFVNTDDDCVLQLEKGICEGTWADQYSKCPLIEAPEPCKDTISRQAAIDTTWEEPSYTDPLNILTEVRDRIKALPSAQPEIIRCKDCKHSRKWRSEESAKKFGQIYGCARNVFDCPKPEDFCSHAKRRTNAFNRCGCV